MTIDIAFALVVSLVFYLLIEFNFVKEYKEEDLLVKYGVYLSIVLACVLAPISEEFLFRWHLRKRYATIYFVLLSISGLIISSLKSTLLGILVFFLFLIIAVFIEIYLKKQSQTKKQLLWKRVFPLVFYFSALLFGVIHLSNFEGLTIHDPAFVIFISSQTFGGLSLGYLRIKYGLKYSILSHAAFNLFALLLSILFPNF